MPAAAWCSASRRATISSAAFVAGARAYAKAHEGELSHHAAAVEADFGTGRVYRIRILGGSRAATVLSSLAAHEAPLGVTLDSGEAGGGADLSPLRELGVPDLAFLDQAL